MITQADRQFHEPRKGVGPLHQQAIEITAASVGDPAELDALEVLALQATGEESELIGWEVEGWIARHGSLLIPPAPPD